MADKILSSMFDDDLDDLLSWKPSSSEQRDKGTNAKNVPAAKPKSKPFSKLDIDFDFEANFELPSFDIDFNFDPTPPEKKNAPTQKDLDSSSPKRNWKAPAHKDFDGIDEIPFDLKGTSNSIADVSKKSKFDSKPSCSKSVKEAQPKRLPERVSKATDIGDFELPGSKVFEAKLDLFEEEVDAGDESPPEENIPVLSKSSKENTETEEETHRPPPEKLPVSRTQIDPKPVNRTARNISPHFQKPGATRNKPSLQHKSEGNSKRTSEARSVSPPGDDHLKPADHEAEGTADEVVQSKSSRHQQHSEQQHISEPVSKSTTNEFCRSDGPEEIKSQHEQLPVREAKRKESSSPPPVPAPVDEGFEFENGHSQLTPIYEEEDNAAGEKKTIEGPYEEDTTLQSRRLEHKDEAPIANSVHRASQSFHEVEAAGQEEAVADAGDCGPASTLPADAASQQFHKTAHISTQATSGETTGKDGDPRKENTKNKTRIEGSIPQRERSKSSIIPRSNLPFGRPVTATKERGDGQDVGAASTRMQFQLLGSKEVKSTIPKAPRKRSPREVTAGPEVQSAVLRDPIEETSAQDEADGTSTKDKRKLAPLPNEEKKEKKQKQVRFQEEPRSPQPQPTQMLKDGGKKRTVMRTVELLSTGFSSLQSSRLGLTASTSVNTEQPVLVNRIVNRTKDSTAQKTDISKTGFFAKSRKRVHTEEQEIPSKRHGLAELAKRKNVRMNRSTSEKKFAFEQIQVGTEAPKRTSTKYTTLQLASKTTLEPNDLPPASASAQTNEGDPAADESLRDSSKKSPEQKILKTSGTPPEENQGDPSVDESLEDSSKKSPEQEILNTSETPPEKNQEAHKRQELPKDFDDTGSDYSAVKKSPSTDGLTRERRNIMEQANTYSDKLDEMMKNLKRLNNDAKDLVVRALICNNKLLMMQSPRNEEKIQMMKASILEVLGSARDATKTTK